MKYKLIPCIILLLVLPTGYAGVAEKLEALERRSGGKLGVYALNTQDGSTIQYRSDERFPTQSTMKAMLAAAILYLSEANADLLQKEIHYSNTDLVTWSPITENRVDTGMTIAELCTATVMYSDNTAANLLLKEINGPNGLTAFARSMGDTTFRLDNWEPLLNTNPNHEEDTSTPKAMALSVQKLLLGEVLADEQRELLQEWMLGNTTGDRLIRASVPEGWAVAEKTGDGVSGIGVIWPPESEPIVLAIFFVSDDKDDPRRKDVAALATRIIIETLQ